MKRLTKGIAVLALLGLMASTANAQMVPGTWYTFSWADLGTISETFVVGGHGEMGVQVVDCCLVGDRFELFADGTSLGATSLTDPFLDGVQTDAFDGATAWADWRLSKGEFHAQAGSTISIDVIQRTSAASTGGAFIRTVTPEPATLLLMATGLFGMGVILRRREED